MSRYFFSFPSDTCSLEASTGIFGSLIKSLSLDERSKNHLNVLISELFTNAFIHGNNGNPQKRIDVELINIDSLITIRIWDEGKSLNGTEFQRLCQRVPDQYGEGGRGIAIVQKLSDSLRMFRDDNGRCCIEAIKNIDELKRPLEWSKSDKGNKEEE